MLLLNNDRSLVSIGSLRYLYVSVIYIIYELSIASLLMLLSNVSS